MLTTVIGRLIVLASLLAACSPSPSDTIGGPCWDGEGGTPGGAVTIGTGTSDFIPLSANQPVPVEPGFQGNHHVNVNVRVSGLEPGDSDTPVERLPKTRITIFDGAERIDNIQCPYQLPYIESQGALGLPAGRLVVLRDEVIADIDGKTLTINVQVIDNAGTVASSSLEVLADLIETGGADAGPDGG